jgi:CRP-like cAMP-binding protein
MPNTAQWIDSGNLLAQIPLFEGMKPGSLAHIASRARFIHAPCGEILFRKDDSCAGLYFVVYGQVKLFFTSQQGNEKILDILDQGHIFGESNLFHDGKHQVYAQTLSDCFLLHIAKSLIMEELGKSMTFAHRVIDHLARRLFELTREVESYSLDTGRQRLINYLLRQALSADRNGANRGAVNHEPNALTLSLRSRKGVLASRLNITHEYFSRLLNELAACGLLSVNGRNIHLKDLNRLRQYATDSDLPTEQPDLQRAMAKVQGSVALSG